MGLFVLVEPGPKRRGASFLAKGDGNLCSISPQPGEFNGMLWLQNACSNMFILWIRKTTNHATWKKEILWLV